MQKQFELRYEGPKDDSAATLRQIKGVFVADLEFPTSDVQRFLENLPAVIKCAGTRQELERDFHLLNKAGARVLIIGPDPAYDTSCLDLDFETVLSNKETELVPVSTEEPQVLAFSLESEPLDSEQKAPPPETKSSEDEPVYDLVTNEEPVFEGLSLETDSAQTVSQQVISAEKQSGAESIPVLELSLEAESSAVEENKTGDPPVNSNAESRLPGGELELFTPEGSTLFGNEKHHAEPAPQSAIPVTGYSSEPVTMTPVLPEPEPEPAFNPQLEDKNVQKNDQEEEIIELTLEDLKALQKREKKMPAHFVIIIFIAIASVALYFINSLLLPKSSDKNPFDSLIQTLPGMTGETDSGPKTNKIQQAAPDSAWYITEKVFPDRSYKLSIWVENKSLVHGSLELTTPKPPPLTKEEIVNKTPPRTWLKRLDLKDFVFKKEGNLWTATGPALAYLTTGDHNSRVSGRALFKANFKENESGIGLRIVASSKVNEVILPEITDPQLRFGGIGAFASEKEYFYFSEQIFTQRP